MSTQSANLPLLNMKQALIAYKNIHKSNPKFGMDVVQDNFDVDDIMILQNNGYKGKGVPVRYDFYVMILCLRGGAKRNVNQYEYTISSNSIQLIPPNTILSFEDVYEETEYYAILFEKNIFINTDKTIDNKILLDFHNENFESVNLESNIFFQIKELYEEINKKYKTKNYDYMNVIKLLLLKILLLLRREKLKLVSYSRKTRANQISEKFLSLIEKNFVEKKTVDAYAKLLDITPKHLSETVKSILGKSALHFIHHRVIKEAQYLLVYSDLSIKQISSVLNFENPSQFTRFFQNHQVISPLKYRVTFKI